MKRSLLILSGALLLGSASLLTYRSLRSRPDGAPPGAATHLGYQRPAGSPTAPRPGVVSRTERNLDPASSAVLDQAAKLADLDESFARQAAITEFISGLLDPQECAAIASDVSRFGHALAGAALRRWVELDPQGAISGFAVGTPQRELRESNLEWMFRAYSDQDPSAALAFAKSLGGISSTERESSIAATLTELAKTNPEAALIELKTLPASVSAGAAAEIYAELARRRSPGDAFADAAQLPGTARSLAQQAVLKVAAASDPDAAVQMWASTDASSRHDLTRALVDGFHAAGADPKAVAEWAFQFAPERGSESVRAEALTHLAEVDPASARALLAQRPIAERDGLSAALANMLDPKAGLEFARLITRREQRDDAMAEVASRMSLRDPQLLYAEIARDSDFGHAAVPAVVDALAYDDLPSAVAYVKSLPDASRGEAASRLLERIDDVAPESALSLAAELVSDPEMRRLSVASSYAAALMNRPGAQLPAIPPGVDHDQVLASVVPLVAFRNPDAAWAAARAIRDEALRVNAVEEVVQALAQVESPDAARRRLAEAGLDARTTEQIRKQIQH